MHTQQVLAIVAASDFAASSEWYARLFGRAPDNGANAFCAEWQITRGTTVQILPAASHTSSRSSTTRASLGIVVDDLDKILLALHKRRIDVAPVLAATQFVRIAPAHDPDGNRVTFVESTAR